jgi:hypothetical protein
MNEILGWFNPTRWLILAVVVAGLLSALAGFGYHQRQIGKDAGRAEVQAKWDKRDKDDAAAREADAREQVKFNERAAGYHAEQVATLNGKLGAAYAKIAQLSGRACLDAGTVSVLNSTGVLDGGTAPSEPASAPASASSGSGLRYSTDRDVAGYIALCRTRYAEVADQLNRILDIEDQRHPQEK